MKRNFFTCLLFALMGGSSAFAANIYVAPDGNDANTGTLSSPYKSLQQAIQQAAPGDYIYLRGGTYYELTGITVARGNDGTAAAPKHIYAYAGETPVLNFSAQAELSTNRGLTLNGHYWHVKGITVEQAGDNGIFIGGNHNTVEKCVTRRNRDTGLQLGRYSSAAPFAEWPADNLILDCESYDNRDATNENADGFACKLTTGPGNVFRGCIAHHNIDDGWDLYTKPETGPIGAVTLENCIAHSNGTLTTGGSSGSGDKNGFKLGGEDIAVNHIVRRCMAFNNGKHGFTFNSNPGSIEVTNCTGYKNAQRNFSFDVGTHVYRNNLSYLSASNDKVIGTLIAPNVFSNTTNWGYTVNAASFQSLTMGPNDNPTGNGFLNLVAGSPMINVGTLATGIAYSGSAPDLGAIEYGGATTPPATTYTLTVNTTPTGGGNVSRNPDKSSYSEGEVVTLTATPAAGYTFGSWGGAASGTSATTTVTLNANTTVSAAFTATGGSGGTGGGTTPPTGSTLRIDNTATTATGLCSYDGTFRTVGSVNVVNLSNTAGKGMNWKVEVPAAGTYSLQWRYAGGGSSAQETAKLLVNGTVVNAAVAFPKPASSTAFLTTTPLNVTLGNGVNEIRIEVLTSAAMGDIEWIEVTGSSPVAANCSAAIGSGGGGVSTPATYTVSTTANPVAGGSISLSPAGGTYNDGTAVTATASPAAGYEFTGWSGDASGTAATANLTVNGNKTLTANFSLIAAAPVTYQLTTAATPGGSVSAGGTFNENTSTTVTATAAAGYVFSGWSGDATGTTNPLTVAMTANKSITAQFSAVAVSGTTIRLEEAVTPTAGYCSVDGKRENTNGGADNGYYLNADNAVAKGINWNVQAPAAGTYQLTWRFASLSGDRAGKLLVNGTAVVPSLSFPATGAWTSWTVAPAVSVNLAAGTNTIRLEATTADGLANIDWMEVTGDNPLAASCGSVAPISYELTTTINGQGTVSPANGTFSQGETVTLTATPAAGWQFAGWSGLPNTTANPVTVTMDGNKAVTAIFWDGVQPVVDNSMIGFAATSGEGYTTTTGGAVAGQPCNTLVISTLAQLEAWGLSREKNTTPQVVYISGKISAPSSTVVTIKNGANVSVLGLGSTAELQNVGLNFRDYKNVIVRNLKIHEVFYPNDGLTIDECQHVWVDHCEFHSIIGPGIGVDTYDGLMDIKNGSRYVTVSWSYFHHHMKTVLIGHTDNAGAAATDSQIRVTFHHNFFEHTDGRNPSLRWGAVHMFNNYLKDIDDYGLAARQGAHALIENNVYENVKLPLATDKFDGVGYICDRGSIFTGTSGANSITQTGCDFWTPATLPYTYTVDPVASVMSLIPANVGVGKVDVSCGATPPPAVTYTLSTSVTGQGTVAPANGTFNSGETATLTATPAAGYQFSGWSGDATGSANPLTVTMNANKVLTATFTATGGGTDTTSNPGTGGGTPTTGPTLRIDNTATTATGLCSYDGTFRTVGSVNVVNLSNTAGKGMNWKVEVPAAGTYSLQWRYAGGGSSAQETAKLLVNGTVVNAAVAFPKPASSTAFLTTTPLNVTLGNGVNEIRIEVLTSAAMGDIEWIEITGNSPAAANCSGAIGSGGSSTAPITYKVTTSVSGEGSVSQGKENYSADESAQLTATPAAGWRFTGWTGDASGHANPLTLTVNAAKSITAVFERKQDQTITLGQQVRKFIGDADFALGAAATSGLPVSYSSSNNAVATVDASGTVHLTGPGATILTVSQGGNDTYNAAEATQVLSVLPLNLQVQHLDGDGGQTANNNLRPYLKVVNNDTVGVLLSELTARYWFTPENGTSVITNIDWAKMGAAKVKARYVALATPLTGATGYVEYSFDATAGLLKAGTNSGEIFSKVYLSTWKALNELNDYSYAANSAYIANNRITLYRNGQLIWGVEPSEGVPTTARMGVEEPLAQLSVTAVPNPSAGSFTLVLAGGETALTLRVFDLAGRMVETQTGVAPNTTLRLGANYRPGVYLTEVIQGDKRRILKLVKQ
ncbi:CBM35 domain-containing protein [Paraflavisolibacter sp. H34]|uniref:InlB B-repeat-containing protein n=1 Tax=Huijunlia imazamoxiresistens TaxID=3127457 RepID=UPI0030185E6B